MTPRQLERTSKFISLVLRHKPEEADIHLDASGWAPAKDLLRGCHDKGYLLTREELNILVEGDDKKRFQFCEDGSKIRAVQGHSVKVDLKYPPKMPPAILYHGTATRFLESIKAQGIIAGSRQQVHLSETRELAHAVGMRHGTPAILGVDSKAMHVARIPFYQAPNGVWLVDFIPVQYLAFDTLFQM